MKRSKLAAQEEINALTACIALLENEKSKSEALDYLPQQMYQEPLHVHLYFC